MRDSGNVDAERQRRVEIDTGARSRRRWRQNGTGVAGNRRRT
jgi:hypothetical protein